MSQESQTTTTGAPAPVTTAPPAPVITRAQVNAEIRSLAETAGLSRNWADAQIDAEATAEEARAAAFDAMRERRSQPGPTTTRAQVTFDHNAPEVVATRAGEALYARLHPEHDLSPPAQPFAHMSLVDHLRAAVQRSGINTAGMGSDMLLRSGAHGISDFPLLLADVGHRELQRGYQQAQSALRKTARQSTVRDFRNKKVLTLGAAPELELVPEHGEYQQATIEEAQESYRAYTYGRVFGLTRQAIINDDLGAFTGIATKQAQAAAALEAQKLVEMIEGNPPMVDGKAVFHSAHGNLGTASALTVDALSAARLALRKQRPTRQLRIG